MVSQHKETDTVRQFLDIDDASQSIGSLMIVSSLPRGGLQVLHARNLPRKVARDYSSGMHTADRVVWGAILGGEAVSGTTAWGSAELEASKFCSQVMKPAGQAFVAAASLSSPLFDGYPGAVLAFRTAERGEFGADDLQALRGLASRLEQAFSRQRAERAANGDPRPAKASRSAAGLFIVTLDGSTVTPLLAPEGADPTLVAGVIANAQAHMTSRRDKPRVLDRVLITDSTGEARSFRVVVYPSYPALSDQPVAFYGMSPTVAAWSTLRATDFPADPEVARLIPAIRYVKEHFAKGPNLGEIAQSARLSPFHFHRQFTQLLGITPKNLLLDCQIDQAKRDLVAGVKDLASVARDCGFAHQSHFTSRFRQATGLTPTRWRRLAQAR